MDLLQEGPHGETLPDFTMLIAKDQDCPAVSGGAGYLCTLDKDHDGPHVAGDGQRICSIWTSDYIQALIDLDTGTIIGTNVVLVTLPDSEEEREELLSSDSAAIGYGQVNGTPVTV